MAAEAAASFPIVVNQAVAPALKEHGHDFNMKSAFLGQVLDAAVSFGVLLAGIIVAVTGRSCADPIIALVISIFIFRTAWQSIG